MEKEVLSFIESAKKRLSENKSETLTGEGFENSGISGYLKRQVCGAVISASTSVKTDFDMLFSKVCKALRKDKSPEIIKSYDLLIAFENEFLTEEE